MYFVHNRNESIVMKILKNIALALLFLFVASGNKLEAQITSTGKTFYMSFMEMETRNGGLPDTLLLFVTSDVNAFNRKHYGRLPTIGKTYVSLFEYFSRGLYVVNGECESSKHTVYYLVLFLIVYLSHHRGVWGSDVSGRVPNRTHRETGELQFVRRFSEAESGFSFLLYHRLIVISGDSVDGRFLG